MDEAAEDGLPFTEGSGTASPAQTSIYLVCQVHGQQIRGQPIDGEVDQPVKLHQGLQLRVDERPRPSESPSGEWERGELRFGAEIVVQACGLQSACVGKGLDRRPPIAVPPEDRSRQLEQLVTSGVERALDPLPRRKCAVSNRIIHRVGHCAAKRGHGGAIQFSIAFCHHWPFFAPATIPDFVV